MSIAAGIAKGLVGALGLSGLVHGCQTIQNNLANTANPPTCTETLHQGTPTTLIDGHTFELVTQPDGTQTIHLDSQCDK